MLTPGIEGFLCSSHPSFARSGRRARASLTMQRVVAFCLPHLELGRAHRGRVPTPARPTVPPGERSFGSDCTVEPRVEGETPSRGRDHRLPLRSHCAYRPPRETRDRVPRQRANNLESVQASNFVSLRPKVSTSAASGPSRTPFHGRFRPRGLRLLGAGKPPRDLEARRLSESARTSRRCEARRIDAGREGSAVRPARRDAPLFLARPRVESIGLR